VQSSYLRKAIMASDSLEALIDVHAHFLTDGYVAAVHEKPTDKAAPRELGGGGLRPLIDAPGTYVFDT
jgi:hypothetical protein